MEERDGDGDNVVVCAFSPYMHFLFGASASCAVSPTSEGIATASLGLHNNLEAYLGHRVEAFIVERWVAAVSAAEAHPLNPPD